ncbi:hypothetical protein NE237_005856 [Protea cynaroides]|uniref:Uncharacterized protein n=1 Tax=Protea cynaroides TaxID=273540 RepID=A0A9Q0KL91_9MAGN|nr:hypothetical protein NE237_005856 [Protea cynaroides]
MKDSIVLYSSPGIGHLICMVEFGRLLLHHYPSFTINILIITPPSSHTIPYIHRISTSTPSIIFINLPTISLPPSSTNHESGLPFDLIRLNNPNVHHALNTISLTSTIRALVIDFFCSPALDIASSLNISTYYFLPSGVAGLVVLLYFPIIHNTTTKSFKDLNTHLHFPGVPPIPPCDMPQAMLDRTSSTYKFFLDMATHMQKSKGIIVNTFETLEPTAIKAISDGICPSPPVYTIGPLIADNDQTGGDNDATKCLMWLDSQPSCSVIFLCFGSFGLFSPAQLKEIAVGLEKSGHRFLWVVRSPPPQDPDFDVLLPERFMERTKDRAWPLYAEQRMNRVFLMEMKLAIPMDEGKDGFVSAAEVEKRVRQMMDSEEGKALRDRVMVMRDAAKAAMSDGGSSCVALAELTESWMRD